MRSSVEQITHRCALIRRALVRGAMFNDGADLTGEMVNSIVRRIHASRRGSGSSRGFARTFGNASKVLAEMLNSIARRIRAFWS